ncbi:Tn3 family transposase [Geobacter grbiciae]|nr:Tn3 family transposase [Geobacter grbiciae]
MENIPLHYVENIGQKWLSGGNFGGKSSVDGHTIRGLAEIGDDLCPAEELFDLLPVFRALFVGAVPGSVAVDSGSILIAGDMGSNFHLAHVLYLLRASLVYVNTLMIQRVLENPEWSERITARDFAALSPLLTQHINPLWTFRTGYKFSAGA